jgi:hypothetical protein
MSNRKMPSNPVATAKRLSLALEMAADLLAGAKNAQAFRAALRSNSILWRDIHAISPLLDWPMSERRIQFTLSTMKRAERGISDQDVETLICVNRATAREIAKLATPETTQPSPAVSDRLSL